MIVLFNPASTKRVDLSVGTGLKGGRGAGMCVEER